MSTKNTPKITYIGGHKEYPSSGKSIIRMYEIEIDLRRQNKLLAIPYSKILNMENMDENKIAAERVVMFGIIGALWKKRQIYTMIHYKDEMDEQTVVFQPLIYRKMLENRKK